VTSFNETDHHALLAHHGVRLVANYLEPIMQKLVLACFGIAVLALVLSGIVYVVGSRPAVKDGFKALTSIKLPVR
jgi:hypothetical protein